MSGQTEETSELREWVGKPLNPWQPETNPLRLAVLGKLAEELAECSAIVSRCIIQGIDESEPETKVLNREALEKELADVHATIADVMQHFNLRMGFMSTRIRLKREHLARWHKLLASGGS